MKMNNLRHIVLGALMITAGCKQDVINLQQPPVVTPPAPNKGTADFSKYVAIGNSLTAGYQAGALFNAGQANSFPLILNTQFQTVGGSATFNQPDINSVNGFNSAVSDPAHGIILGRFILFAADGKQADAVPTPAGYPGVPAPYNTADFPGPYTGDKSKLNNFGVPGILLAQVLTPATGGPAASNPAYNPFYFRFASNPSTDGVTGSSILSDAIAAQPTFFSFDLGNNDVLGYATSGGDAHIVPLTDKAAFSGYYSTAIGALLASATNPHNPKGIVSTIPDVTDLPFFFTVPYNAIPLDAPTAAAVTAELATGYNGFLQVMAANHFISAAEATQRTLTFSPGQNAILISDTDLTNLAPFMTGDAAALAPYARARQTTAGVLVTLTAGSVLGTLVGGNPALVNGVTVPLADKYVLVPSEIDSIEDYTSAYNASIKATAAAFPGRVAVADINAAFKAFVQTGTLGNGVTLNATFTPPFGAFSEDGVHPNSRGYAYLANIFIQAIETEFSATIPLADLSAHSGVGLPLVP